MTLLPEMRDQLEAAARRRAGGSTARLSAWHRRSWVRAAAFALPVLVVAGVVAVIVAQAHHSGQTAPAGPAPGATVPRAWRQWSRQAIEQTQRRDPSCRPRPITGPNPLRHGQPPHRLTSELAVLAHPATGDRRVSAQQLRQLHVGLSVRGIYIRYVQRGERNGVDYYLIPAANVNNVYPVVPRCYEQESKLFGRHLSTLKPTRRHAARQFELTVMHAQRAQTTTAPGVCLAHTGGGAGTGGGLCASSSELHHVATASRGSDGTDHVTVTPLVVPDSVASVTAHYTAQSRPGRIAHAFDTEQRPSGNVVFFVLRGAWDPPSLTFRFKNGAVQR
jgi:hypothetical protein